MPELTLSQLSTGRYALGDIGTLEVQGLVRSEIAAGGESWTVKPARRFAQTIHGRSLPDGELVCRYVPRGFLHLRGIYGGTIARGDRAFDWRANRQLGHHFELTEDGIVLASFSSGYGAEPVTTSVDEVGRLEPLLLLFCCYIVKRVADLAQMG